MTDDRAKQIEAACEAYSKIPDDDKGPTVINDYYVEMYDCFEDGAKWADAHPSDEVMALVESLKSAHDEFVERYNKNSTDYHLRWHIKDISKALSAFNKSIGLGEK